MRGKKVAEKDKSPSVAAAFSFLSKNLSSHLSQHLTLSLPACSHPSRPPSDANSHVRILVCAYEGSLIISGSLIEKISFHLLVYVPHDLL